MSDEASTAKGFGDAAQIYGGWVVATCAAVMTWLLKLALRRHLIGLARLEKKVDLLVEDVAEIRGRFKERDHRGDQR
jgi:hypothetical protein